MEKTRVTPKDFFLWAGAMVSFYVSVFSLLALFFDYIDTAFPDALNYNYDPYSTAVRLSIACLVVLFPIFLTLMYFIRRDVRMHHEKQQLWVRRWALVLTIFVGGATMAIDLITLINTYLNGNLSEPFILKVLVVFLVVAGAFLHFLADIWGYWDKNPRYAQSIGWASGVLVVLTIIAGIFIIGTPGAVRLYRFDDQKVNDLESIQSQIVSYWQQQGKLPTNLADLNNSITDFTVPTDEQTGISYEYDVLSTYSFKLCADFNAATQSGSPTLQQSYAATYPGMSGGLDMTWYHGAGHTCFTQTIDPKRYPVNTTITPIEKPSVL